ncbi:sensor histidine kinase [Flavobacterium sp. RHBU_24]|uniref:sensor histidine kinase n=1 Tax=Flavobacterium sp. RHBU_24 TaxID=3391185 RepID=UPI0039854541
MAKRTQKYILHLLGCVLFISIPILSSPDFNNNTNLFSIPHFRRSLLAFVLLLLFFYANYLYLIPRFYFTRKLWLFYAAVLGCFAFVTFLPNLLIPIDENPFIIIRPQMPGSRGLPPNMAKLHTLPFFLGRSLLLFLLVFSLSFLLGINQRLSDIESEKLKTELSYLKAQINPHFLFNTLNSLYALALEKSDATPEAILKLSGMMRYVVSESSRDLVPLESEIAYINNYISLQKLRMDENTYFSFETTGSPASRYISPMLLIPFIENAFKYGINPEEDAAISITIAITNNQLSLTVRNNKVHAALPYEEESGHGIENTRLRLEYLYTGKYSLTIKDETKSFEVQLTIGLV